MANNDNAMTRFLFAILKQKNLKDIDWNKVAHDPILLQEISNGHAARMRYSRFRAAMLGESQRRSKIEKNKNRVVKHKRDPRLSYGHEHSPGGSAVKPEPEDEPVDDTDEQPTYPWNSIKADPENVGGYAGMPTNAVLTMNRIKQEMNARASMSQNYQHHLHLPYSNPMYMNQYSHPVTMLPPGQPRPSMVFTTPSPYSTAHTPSPAATTAMMPSGTHASSMVYMASPSLATVPGQCSMQLASQGRQRLQTPCSDQDGSGASRMSGMYGTPSPGAQDVTLTRMFPPSSSASATVVTASAAAMDSSTCNTANWMPSPEAKPAMYIGSHIPQGSHSEVAQRRFHYYEKKGVSERPSLDTKIESTGSTMQ